MALNRSILNPDNSFNARALYQTMQIAGAITNIDTVGKIAVDWTSVGLRITDLRLDWRIIKITSGSNPYAWTEQTHDGDGTYTNGIVTGTATVYPAYEVNGKSDVAANTVVLAYPSPDGNSLLFDVSNAGMSPFTLIYQPTTISAPSAGYLIIFPINGGLRTTATNPDGTVKKCCIPCKPVEGQDFLLWLQFEETGGTAYDSSGNGLDFTDANASEDVAGQVVHGTNLGARQFDAADTDYLTRAYSTDWAISTGDFMIAVWAYYDTSGSVPGYIIAKAAGGGTAWSLHLDASANVIFTFGGKTVTSSSTVAVATWVLIHAWYDSSDGNIRVTLDNGAADATAAASHTDGSATIYVGQDTADGNYWDGRLDELIVAKSVPSADNRTRMYNNGNGTKDPDCGRVEADDLLDIPNTQGNYAQAPESPGDSLTAFNPGADAAVREYSQSIKGD